MWNDYPCIIGLGKVRYWYQNVIGRLLPSNIYVCHHCDHPHCRQIEHIFLGTQSDNLKDCVAKGRHVGHSGKHHSEEAKLAMSNSHKGNKARLGMKASEETKKAMSIAAMGNKNWKGK